MLPVRTERDGPITTIIIDRPEARNAMSPEAADALCEAFRAFEADDNASVAVLYGDHGVFCAGWDLKHVARTGGSLELDKHNYPCDLSEPPRGALGPTRMELNKPVIAAVSGPAVAGGFELALWADIRVMEEQAFMGVFCRRWGVPLGDGGTVRLPRVVGMGRALEIIMTGRKVPAEECLQLGLCEKLVPKGESRAAAEALAREIARFPQGAVRADRKSVYMQRGRPERDALMREWYNCLASMREEGANGATRFAEQGKGRHGDFSEDIF
jgi:enoyl-CoA hydratase